MIIELIGASGAGKTTLMHAALRRAPTTPVVSAWDLVMDRPVLRTVTTSAGVNLVADASALGPFIRSAARHRELVAFVRDRLRRGAPSRPMHLNYLRNVVRKVGMYELARQRGTSQAVMFDEGAVLMAYQLFVYNELAWSRGDLEVFASLVPLPDRLVHVHVPVPVLVERALSRPDPRRELAGRHAGQLVERLDRANEMFDALTSTPALRDRVVRVEGTGDPARRERLVDVILAPPHHAATGHEPLRIPGQPDA